MLRQWWRTRRVRIAERRAARDEELKQMAAEVAHIKIVLASGAVLERLVHGFPIHLDVVRACWCSAESAARKEALDIGRHGFWNDNEYITPAGIHSVTVLDPARVVERTP